MYNPVCSFKKELSPWGGTNPKFFFIILTSINSHGIASQIGLENRELENALVCCGFGRHDRLKRENVASIVILPNKNMPIRKIEMSALLNRPENVTLHNLNWGSTCQTRDNLLM
jgi:hypothetical protein